MDRGKSYTSSGVESGLEGLGQSPPKVNEELDLKTNENPSKSPKIYQKKQINRSPPKAHTSKTLTKKITRWPPKAYTGKSPPKVHTSRHQHRTRIPSAPFSKMDSEMHISPEAHPMPTKCPPRGESIKK